MTQENHNTKTFLIGALLGGIVGLLFAPKSGERLRQDISSACKQLADEAKDVASDAKDSLEEHVEHGKESAKHLAEEAKEKLHDTAHAVKKK